MEDKERLARLEANTANISKEVSEIKNMLQKHIESDDSYHKEIAGDFDRLDNRYASKVVEHIMKAVVVIIIGALIAMVA